MSVLGNLPRQRLAIRRRHPVVGFDAIIGIDPCLEMRGALRVLDMNNFSFRCIERLGVHRRFLPGDGIQYITRITLSKLFL